MYDARIRAGGESGACALSRYAQDCCNEINTGCLSFWQIFARQSAERKSTLLFRLDELHPILGVQPNLKEYESECFQSFIKVVPSASFPLFYNFVDKLVKNNSGFDPNLIDEMVNIQKFLKEKETSGSGQLFKEFPLFNQFVDGLEDNVWFDQKLVDELVQIQKLL